MTSHVQQPGEAPSHVGRYQIVGLLGLGGMGVVYRGIDPHLGRDVAIKMIRDPGLVKLEDMQRFEIEAQTSARLRHPGIVAVHEVGIHGSSPYLVMDFVAGKTLEAHLQMADVSPREVAVLMQQIARALDHAHRHQVIHRDVKPQNILIDEEGKPRLTDFGLARDMAHDRHLTVTGQVLGTPAYMAPEQAEREGDGVDIRVDVYGLGAVLYRCLAGHAPFQANNPVAVMRKVLLEDPPPLQATNARIHSDLVTITQRCLEKQRRQRYSSAAEVADELERFLNGEAILARPLGALGRMKRWASRNPLGAGLLAVLVVGALLSVGLGILGAVWSVGRIREERDVAQRALNRAMVQQRRAEHARVATETAHKLAQRREEEARTNLAKVTLADAVRARSDRRVLEAEALAGRSLILHDTVAARSLVNQARAEGLTHLWSVRVRDAPQPSLEFTPDHNQVAVTTNQGVMMISTDTGDWLWGLPHDAPVTAMTFSPDGAWLATGTKNGWLRVWSLDTQQEVTAQHVSSREIISTTWDPEGEHLFAIGQDHGLAILGTGSWEIQASMPAEEDTLTWAEFSNDCRLLAYSSGHVIRLQQLAMGFFAKPILVKSGWVTRLAFSNDQHMLFAGLSDGQLQYVHLEAEPISEMVSLHRLAVSCLAASHETDLIWTGSLDGSLVAWDAREARVRYRLNLRGRRITGLAASADGSRLAVGADDGTIRTYSVKPREMSVGLLPPGVEVSEISAAADTETVLVACRDGVVRRIDVDSGESSQALDSRAGHMQGLTRSANGRVLVCQLDAHRLVAWDLDRAEWLASPQGPQLLWPEISLGHRGQTLAALDKRGQLMVWNVKDGQVLHQAQGLNSSMNHGHRIILGPNGRHLAWLSKEQAAEVLEMGSWNTSLQAQMESPVLAVAMDAGGRYLAVGSVDGVGIWDLDRGARVKMVRAPRGEFATLTFSPTGAWLACGGAHGRLLLLDASQDWADRSLVGHDLEVVSFSFSKQESLLASGSLDRTMRVWDLATASPMVDLAGHQAAVEQVAFAGDNDQWLISRGQDGRLLRMNLGGLEAFLNVPAGAVLDETLRRTGLEVDGPQPMAVDPMREIEWPKTDVGD